jgi:hypothetical protein
VSPGAAEAALANAAQKRMNDPHGGLPDRTFIDLRETPDDASDVGFVRSSPDRLGQRRRPICETAVLVGTRRKRHLCASTPPVGKGGTAQKSRHSATACERAKTDPLPPFLVGPGKERMRQGRASERYRPHVLAGVLFAKRSAIQAMAAGAASRAIKAWPTPSRASNSTAPPFRHSAWA